MWEEETNRTSPGALAAKQITEVGSTSGESFSNPPPVPTSPAWESTHSCCCSPRLVLELGSRSQVYCQFWHCLLLQNWVQLAVWGFWHHSCFLPTIYCKGKVIKFPASFRFSYLSFLYLFFCWTHHDLQFTPPLLLGASPCAWQLFPPNSQIGTMQPVINCFTVSKKASLFLLFQ